MFRRVSKIVKSRLIFLKSYYNEIYIYIKSPILILILIFNYSMSFSQTYNINGQWKSNSGHTYTIKQSQYSIDYSDEQGHSFHGSQTGNNTYTVRFNDGYNTIITVSNKNSIRAYDSYNKKNFYWNKINVSNQNDNSTSQDVGLNGRWERSSKNYYIIKGSIGYDKNGIKVLKNIKYLGDWNWSCDAKWGDEWCNKQCYIGKKKDRNDDVYIVIDIPCMSSDLAVNYYKVK